MQGGEGAGPSWRALVGKRPTRKRWGWSFSELSPLPSGNHSIQMSRKIDGGNSAASPGHARPPLPKQHLSPAPAPGRHLYQLLLLSQEGRALRAGLTSPEGQPPCDEASWLSAPGEATQPGHLEETTSSGWLPWSPEMGREGRKADMGASSGLRGTGEIQPFTVGCGGGVARHTVPSESPPGLLGSPPPCRSCSPFYPWVNRVACFLCSLEHLISLTNHSLFLETLDSFASLTLLYF